MLEETLAGVARVITRFTEARSQSPYVPREACLVFQKLVETRSRLGITAILDSGRLVVMLRVSPASNFWPPMNIGSLHCVRKEIAIAKHALTPNSQ